MIKLTEFTSVVDTYKKNFDIRSKRFSDKKKKDQAANKEQREARIESKKFFSSVGAKVAEKIKPGSNVLDSVIRFAGFTLLGLLVKNLDKVAAFAKQVIEKIKEFAVRLRKYFDDVLVPLYNDIVELGTQIKNTFGDISNFVIRMNPYNELSDVLGTVMSGILALGYRLASLYRPFTKPTTPGVTPPATKAPVKTPVTTPVKTPIKARTKTFTKNPLKTAIPTKTTTPTQTPVSAGGGAGSGSQSGVPRQTSASGMLRSSLLNMLDDLSDQGIRALADEYNKVRGPYSKLPEPTPKGQLTVNQILGRAISGDISRLMQFYRKGNFSVSDLVKIANDIEGESFNERQAAYRLLQKKNLAYKVTNIPDASQYFPKPVDRTATGKLQQSKFFAPDIPKPKPIQTLSPIERLKSLTKGLDFRFDAKGVIKNQLLNPKNLLSNIKSFGIGIGLDMGAKFLGKYISSILPYNEDFELLAYLGMIDPDRIHQLTAGKIINLPEDKRRRAIKNLKRDSKSPDDIFGTGQRKRDVANGILKYISIFSGGEFGSFEKPQIKQDTELERLEFPEHFAPKSDQKIKPGMIVPGEYTPEELKQLREIQKQFGSQSSISKPSMVASVNRNVSDGLNATTYGNQGVMISREVVIAIQPVELPA